MASYLTLRSIELHRILNKLCPKGPKITNVVYIMGHGKVNGATAQPLMLSFEGDDLSENIPTGAVLDFFTCFDDLIFSETLCDDTGSHNEEFSIFKETMTTVMNRLKLSTNIIHKSMRHSKASSQVEIQSSHFKRGATRASSQVEIQSSHFKRGTTRASSQVEIQSSHFKRGATRMEFNDSLQLSLLDKLDIWLGDNEYLDRVCLVEVPLCCDDSPGHEQSEMHGLKWPAVCFSSFHDIIDSVRMLKNSCDSERLVICATLSLHYRELLIHDDGTTNAVTQIVYRVGYCRNPAFPLYLSICHPTKNDNNHHAKESVYDWYENRCSLYGACPHHERALVLSDLRMERCLGWPFSDSESSVTGKTEDTEYNSNITPPTPPPHEDSEVGPANSAESSPTYKSDTKDSREESKNVHSQAELGKGNVHPAGYNTPRLEVRADSQVLNDSDSVQFNSNITPPTPPPREDSEGGPSMANTAESSPTYNSDTLDSNEGSNVDSQAELSTGNVHPAGVLHTLAKIDSYNTPRLDVRADSLVVSSNHHDHDDDSDSVQFIKVVPGRQLRRFKK